MSSSKQSFFKGALVLTAATFIVKFINIFFSVPLANFLGDEGMGHFYTAYDIFIFFNLLATTGTPVAVSRMVSMAYAKGRKKQADKIFNVAFALFACIGIVGSTVMIVFSKQFSVLFTKADRTWCAIAALAPMLFFMCLTSCVRGYFQGRSNMLPTAVSQILESVIKLIIGTVLAFWLFNTTGLPELGATGAIVGVSVGSLFAMIYIITRYLREKKRLEYDPEEQPVSSAKSILKDIATFAVPVMLGSVFLNALDLVDAAIMMHRLQNAAGFAYEEAMGMKGWLGNARKYFDLPNAIIVPISTTVLPMLSGAVAKKDEGGIREISTLTMRLTLMFAAPCAVGLLIFAQPICELLLFNQPIYAQNTAPLLAVMAPAVVAASLLYITNSMIHAVGEVYKPILNMAIGTVIRIIIVYILCGMPQVAAMGSAVATLVSYYIIIVLNMHTLHKLLPQTPDVLKMALRPVAASGIMAAVSYPVYWLLTLWVSPKVAVLPAIFAAILAYAAAGILTKVITKDDVVHLPKGGKIAKLLRLK